MKDEAAYRSHHTRRASDGDGPRRLSEVGVREGRRELRKLKGSPIDES